MLNLENIFGYVDQQIAKSVDAGIKLNYQSIKSKLLDYKDLGKTEVAEKILISQIPSFSYDVQIFVENYLSGKAFTCFYIDVLDKYVAKIPVDVDLTTFLQQTTLIYNSFIHEYAELEKQGYVFSDFPTQKFKNFIDSIKALKQYDLNDPNSMLQNIIVNSAVLERLKKYFTTAQTSQIKVAKNHLQYVKLSRVPFGKESELLTYKERETAEFSEPIDSSYQIAKNELDYLKPSKSSSEKQIPLEEMEVKNVNNEDVEKKEQISKLLDDGVQEKSKLDANITNEFKDLLTSYFQQLKAANEINNANQVELKKAIASVVSVLDSKDLSLSANKLLQQFNDYEPDTSIGDNLTKVLDDLSKINDKVNKLYEGDKLDSIGQGIEHVLSKINDFIEENKELSLIIDLLGKHAGDAEKNSKQLNDDIIDFSNKLKEVIESNSGIDGLMKKLNTELINTATKISQMTKSFDVKVEEFKIILNDGLLKTLESYMNSNADLSRNVRILQTTLDSSKPSKQVSSIMLIGFLNVVMTIIIIVMLFINNGYKNDSIELNKIINNVNKLDQQNRANVIKALDINM